MPLRFDPGATTMNYMVWPRAIAESGIGLMPRPLWGRHVECAMYSRSSRIIKAGGMADYVAGGMVVFWVAWPELWPAILIAVAADDDDRFLIDAGPHMATPRR